MMGGQDQAADGVGRCNRTEGYFFIRLGPSQRGDRMYAQAALKKAEQVDSVPKEEEAKQV
jgi:hypothetical protein